MRTRPSAINPFGYTRKGFAFDRVEASQPQRLLDYGAHDGELIAQLVSAGVAKHATGVDMNRKVVATSSEGLPPNADLAAIEAGAALPFEDGHFDMITMLDVIEHVLDQGMLLRELCRVLRPGGELVVTVPRRYPLSFLDTGNWKFRFPKLHHAVFVAMRSREEYDERYVACVDGLFGDIELGKNCHQHFTEAELDRLLQVGGFEIGFLDGSALFDRVLAPVARVSGRASSPLGRLRNLDAKTFHSSNLFVVAKKPW